MSLKQKLTTHLMERCGGIVDIKESPEVLDEIVNEVRAHLEAEKGSGQSTSSAPFGVPWMDSWVAHQVFAERVSDLQSKNREVASLLQGMVEVQFNARLAEIRNLINRVAEPPDGGTPEPGVPPVGPSRAHTPTISTASEPGSPPVGPAGPNKITTASEPGSPPVGPAGPNRISTASEPGSPPVGPAGGRTGAIFTDEPEPPDGGPPEPGVPDPPAGPDPGGPDAGRFGTIVDNPWILYWFISVKTPMLLDVIDLHITRRLEALHR